MSRAWLLCTAVLLSGLPAAAEDAGQVLLVARGSQYQYQVHKAPRFAARLGAVALAGLDAAAGRRRQVPSALGERPAKGGSAGASGRAPFGVRGRKRCRNCATTIGDGRVERTAVLRATRSFETGDPRQLSSLELRMRYRDGIVVRINDREVVRRNLEATASAVAIARRKRGPEWESVWLPVTPGLLRSGGNRVDIEVRPSGYRDGPFLDFELVGWHSSQLTRGPLVQRKSPTDAVVRFTTDAPVKA
ncbi:MAG: hypothetical protein KJO07_19260, partial [Deltaproteobacteria bacterium]|nr:hypothetical protein [Deltaproteobacteria bacterium]